MCIIVGTRPNRFKVIINSHQSKDKSNFLEIFLDIHTRIQIENRCRIWDQVYNITCFIFTFLCYVCFHAYFRLGKV